MGMGAGRLWSWGGFFTRCTLSANSLLAIATQTKRQCELFEILLLNIIMLAHSLGVQLSQ
jgi:hypothetical protein